MQQEMGLLVVGPLEGALLEGELLVEGMELAYQQSE